MKQLLPFLVNPSQLFDRSAWTEDLARRAFAAVLVSIGLLGLVETLLAPGRLIRRPMGFAAVEPLAVPIPSMDAVTEATLHPTVAAIDGFLGTDKQRENAREKNRQQIQSLIEARYQLARRSLDTAHAEWGRSWDQMVGRATEVVSVDLSVQPYDARQTPARLHRLVLEDDSVEAAWSSLRQAASGGHRLRSDLAAHLLIQADHLASEADVVDYRTRTEALIARIASHRTELDQAVKFDLEHLRIALAADLRLNP